MNYYERHIGDYIKDTVSLSMLEDGAYNRLIDQIYATEKLLSLDRKEIYRLARAASLTERKAVDYVLDKFFDKTPDGYAQKRIQSEIARFQDKQKKAKASADARWSKDKTKCDSDANVHADGMRTHCERNALQSPVTSNQTKEEYNPAVRVPSADAADDSKPLTAKDLIEQGVDPQVAADWLKVRKAKKAPLTRTAWDGVKREGEIAGMTPAQAVKYATESGWQGFKASWIGTKNGAAGARASGDDWTRGAS